MTTPSHLNSIYALQTLSLQDPLPESLPEPLSDLHDTLETYQYLDSNSPGDVKAWPFAPDLVTVGDKLNGQISSSSSSSNSRASSITETPTDLAPADDSRPRRRMRSPPPPIPIHDLDHQMEGEDEENDEDSEDEFQPVRVPAKSRNGLKSSSRRFALGSNSGLFKRNNPRRAPYEDRENLYPGLRSENEKAILRARRQEQIRAYKARSISESRQKRRTKRDGRNSRRANLIWNSHDQATDPTPAPAPEDEDGEPNGRLARRVHFAV